MNAGISEERADESKYNRLLQIAEHLQCAQPSTRSRDRSTSLPKSCTHFRLLVVNIPRISLRPKFLVVFVRLICKLRRSSERCKWYASFLEFCHPRPRELFTLVHAEYFDPVARARYVQTPA
jgi:hypothetical protein